MSNEHERKKSSTPRKRRVHNTKSEVDASDKRKKKAPSSDNDSESASDEDMNERNGKKNRSGDSDLEGSDTSSASGSEVFDGNYIYVALHYDSRFCEFSNCDCAVMLSTSLLYYLLIFLG